MMIPTFATILLVFAASLAVAIDRLLAARQRVRIDKRRTRR
jgi:hypothetical protein